MEIESSAPPRRVRYHWRNGNEYYPCNRCRRETPRRSRDVQRRRCRASLETIRASLTGNDRDEHVFSLRQSLELYDTYQSKIAEYDRALEASMAALIDEVEKPAKPRSKARVQTKQVNAPSFDVRAALLYGMLGVDLDSNSWIRAFAHLEARQRMRARFEGLPERQTLHVVALPCSRKQDLRTPRARLFRKRALILVFMLLCSFPIASLPFVVRRPR